MCSITTGTIKHICKNDNVILWLWFIYGNGVAHNFCGLLLIPITEGHAKSQLAGSQYNIGVIFTPV